MMTALLLSLEQLLFNDYNPNRHAANKKDSDSSYQKVAETKLLDQMIEKISDTT